MKNLIPIVVISLFSFACGEKKDSEPAKKAPEVAEPSAATAEAKPSTDEPSAEQSFEDGMKHLCSAMENIDMTNIVDSAAKAVELAKWIEKGLTNPEALSVWEGFEGKEAPAKVIDLKAAAEKAGLESCGLVALFESMGEPTP